MLEVSVRTSLQMYTKPKPVKLSRTPRTGRTSVTSHFTETGKPVPDRAGEERHLVPRVP